MSIPKQTLSAGACLLVLASAALAGRSAPPVPARKAGYEGYALVQTRNIFDPERMPGVVYTPEVNQPQTTTPVAGDYAALTGTLLTAERTLAFFSGSRPEYNRVISVGGRIAGASLKKIDPNSIEVERAGKCITVAVGQTVPLNSSAVPGQAPAPVALPVATPSPYTFNSPTVAAPSISAAPTPGTADREALMRRMMEKRQQELK